MCAPLPNRSAQGRCKTTRCREAPTRARAFDSISSFVRATAATRTQACAPAWCGSTDGEQLKQQHFRNALSPTGVVSTPPHVLPPSTCNDTILVLVLKQHRCRMHGPDRAAKVRAEASVEPSKSAMNRLSHFRTGNRQKEKGVPGTETRAKSTEMSFEKFPASSDYLARRGK